MFSPSAHAKNPDQSASAAMSVGTAQQSLRASINEFVTTCELLKMEAQDVDDSMLCQALDVARNKAHAVLHDLSLLLENGGSDPIRAIQASEHAKKATAELLDSVGSIQGVSSNISGPDFAEEMLRLQCVAHRLTQIAERVNQPDSGGRANADASTGSKATVLVVDDDDHNRDLLSRLIRPDGYQILTAASGSHALQLVTEKKPDLVLLDLVMPKMNGLEVLRAFKRHELVKDTPVIMVSGIDDIEGITMCLENGAEDYVLKPFNTTVLRARLRGSLERKLARDQEHSNAEELRTAVQQLEAERRRTEELLLNILPHSAAVELREKGAVSPTYFEEVTIVFTDFVGFTFSTEKLSAEELVGLLHEYFTAFDEIAGRYELEKLKTVGDSYMFVSGIPSRSPSHAVDAVLASLEMMQFVRMRRENNQPGWDMRIGMHSGSVVAGVVGSRKFAFDIWGDAVNFASRMVSSGGSNRINLSERTYQRVKDFFTCSARGSVPIKGNRTAEMYFVDGVIPSLLDSGEGQLSVLFHERYKKYFRRELTAFPGNAVLPIPAAQ
jgi:adenylate cyclase